MTKYLHEIRDPVHVFVYLDSTERAVLDSRPFQRLRHVHQLALTCLVYPGATHKRFEHSLGVMELATRVYDRVTKHEHLSDAIRDLLPQTADEDALRYWRRVLRVAALCHDLGHLPFSHAAEVWLLPEGWDHEKLTTAIIYSDEMAAIWGSMTPPLRADDIVKLAVGPKKASDISFSDWEAILAEIITGDAFGVDRIDYLLRDSHHAGVAYGRFDHYRLIDTLKILTPPPVPGEGDESREPMLGVEEGGLHSAEALLLARYFMYSQLYCHPIRRIYDIHLRDFLMSWLPEGKFSTDIQAHLGLTDNEIMTAILSAALDPAANGFEPARRIVNREHFRVLYQRNPDDILKNLAAAETIHLAAAAQFGEENVRFDSYTQKGGAPDFPVWTRDGRIVSSLSISQVLNNVPVAADAYVFVEPRLREEAEGWLKENRESILSSEGEELG